MKAMEVVVERAMAVEERPWPPPQGQWTYQDYLHLPDDGMQYEIIKGVLYMVPAPTTEHQRASRNLEFQMWEFARRHHLGEVFDAPTDVYLPGQETPVQPDILFVAAGRAGIIQERGIEGAPDLVVEILSPRTWWQDRKIKLPLYEETGVPECWIVDPDQGTIEVYGLERGVYALLGHWGRGEVVVSRVLPGFQVAVDQVLGPAPSSTG